MANQTATPGPGLQFRLKEIAGKADYNVKAVEGL